LKRLLELQSLSGIVYSITEIPVDLIREIVAARIAELAGGAPLGDCGLQISDCGLKRATRPACESWPGSFARPPVSEVQIG
jgi:hypothetical protein